MVFRQFDDHLLGTQAAVAQQVQGLPLAVPRQQKHLGADVEKQLSLDFLFDERADDRLPAGFFQFDKAPVPAGHAEQGIGCGKRRVGGAANQPLETIGRSVIHADDGLEYRVQFAAAQNPVQQDDLFRVPQPGGRR